jgi:hypothetical protein
VFLPASPLADTCFMLMGLIGFSTGFLPMECLYVPTCSKPLGWLSIPIYSAHGMAGCFCQLEAHWTDGVPTCLKSMRQVGDPTCFKAYELAGFLPAVNPWNGWLYTIAFSSFMDCLDHG